MKPGDWAVAAVVFALVLAACSSSAEDGDHFDPSSTDQFGVGGGGVYPQVVDEEIGRVTDLLAVVTVIDVHPSRPNTLNGELPDISKATAGDLLEMTPMTPVDVRVDSVLAARVESTIDVDSGDMLTIEVPGGVWSVSLTVDEALALGLDREILEPDAEGFVDFSVTVAPGVSLSEGTSLGLALSVQQVERTVAVGRTEFSDSLQVAYGSQGTFPLDPNGQPSARMLAMAQLVDSATFTP